MPTTPEYDGALSGISSNFRELRPTPRQGRNPSAAWLDELLNFPFLEPSITVLERCKAEQIQSKQT